MKNDDVALIQRVLAGDETAPTLTNNTNQYILP